MAHCPPHGPVSTGAPLPVLFGLFLMLPACGGGGSVPDPFDPETAAEGLALGPPAWEVPRAWDGERLPFPPDENPGSPSARSGSGPSWDPPWIRAGVDAWLLVLRENHNDPLAHHVGGENAGGTAAFLFFREGDGPEGMAGVRSLALSPAGRPRPWRTWGSTTAWWSSRGRRPSRGRPGAPGPVPPSSP
jgi:hypothetical protein